MNKLDQLQINKALFGMLNLKQALIDCKELLHLHVFEDKTDI
jgi:hypothetical protein